MSHPEKKHEENVQMDKNSKQDKEPGLQVGELKWSKDQDQQKAGSVNDQEKDLSTDDSSQTIPVSNEGNAATEENLAEKEASATLAYEEAIKDDHPPQKDPLQNIEDTQTHMPIIEYPLEQNFNKNSQGVDKSQKKENDKQDEKLFGITVGARTKRVVKIVWFPALLIFSLFLGLIIGHTIIGDEPVGDLFDIGMWQHLYTLVFE